MTDEPSTRARPRRRGLDVFFHPASVAVVGASERGVGRALVRNLLSTPFGGTVYPVNPRHPSVLGVRAYASIAAVPEPIDLAVVATPAPTVPDIVGECVRAEVGGVVIISAGFRECGAAGAALEARVREEAAKGPIRVIGPNCLGVMSPPTGLNATFAAATARPGSVAFLSQSGALCTSVLDWSLRENVGFSAFLSLGSMVDVGWGDLIVYLGDDPQTRSIVIYMESIGDARRFLSAAREVALTKPIIVLKPGRTQAAARAAASHTGALAGADEVLEAAFRRSGVLRVGSIDDLFCMAEVLAKQPRPKGPRLAIVTNAGGPGVLATDALMTSGGELAPLADTTLASLDQLLPPHWSHGNPIDILGDADPDRYVKALEIAARDPQTDGVLAILTPQAMTDATRTAERVTSRSLDGGKPILASWMGGASVADGEAILNASRIPTFPYPDSAARVFSYMWRYSDNLRSLYEVPTLPTGLDEAAPAASRAREIVRQALGAGRTLLTEVESKQVLAAYGLPTVEMRAASSEDEAVAAAREIGYPAVLKVLSTTVTHKTDVGGVELSLADEPAVRRAYGAIAAAVAARAGADAFGGVTVEPMVRLDEGYELILGSSVDEQFGRGTSASHGSWPICCPTTGRCSTCSREWAPASDTTPRQA